MSAGRSARGNEPAPSRRGVGPTLAALLTLLPTAARGGCLHKPFDLHPEKNDGVVVDVIVDAGSACTHNRFLSLGAHVRALHAPVNAVLSDGDPFHAQPRGRLLRTVRADVAVPLSLPSRRGTVGVGLKVAGAGPIRHTMACARVYSKKTSACD